MFFFLKGNKNETGPYLVVHLCGHFSSAILPPPDDDWVSLDVSVFSTAQILQLLPGQ
jgi:hypothetical protein